MADYRYKHPDYHKRYYEKNKECLKEKVKEWRKKHPDKVKKWKSDYYKRHREQILKKEKNRRLRNLEEYRKKGREMYRKNIVKRRQQNRASLMRLKLWIVNKLGGRCKICNYDKNLAVLVTHHKDRSIKEGRSSLEAWRKWRRKNKIPDTIQLLCHNCHSELHHPEWDKNNIK